MAKLFFQNLDLKNKRVLLRVDFNVPQDDTGHITDDTRIKETLPTIQYILEQDGKLILLSHLGKPKGKKNLKLSLQPIAIRLSELLKKPVVFAKDCIGDETKAMIDSLHPGGVILLENLRFHAAEEKPEIDPTFAKTLSTYGDVYIDDAFGNAHRNHASNVVLPSYFPNKSAYGFLMEKELKFLGNTLTNPDKPFYAIIGGSKVSGKLGVLKTLLTKVDTLLIGGAMAYTFLKAKGYFIGSSKVEEDLIPEANLFLEEAKSKNRQVVLPIDHLITNDLTGNGIHLTVSAKDGIPEGFYGVDIGEKTIELFLNEITHAKTILWNGPVGIFEVPEFSKGTMEIAKKIASLSESHSIISIVGGGDSIAALNQAKVFDKITHVSTGGGASLEFIEKGKLPAIEVLTEVKNN